LSRDPVKTKVPVIATDGSSAVFAGDMQGELMADNAPLVSDFTLNSCCPISLISFTDEHF